MDSKTVLPCYLACDDSLSMAGHAQAVGGIVASFVESLQHASGTGPDRVRLGLIGFSDSARVLRPLGPLGTFEMPSILGRGTSITSFRTAFRFLLGTIEADVGRLLAGAGVGAVRRPVVLFVSDGQATDPATWQSAHATLVDPARSAHPHLITEGVGDADGATLRRIATRAPATVFRAAEVMDGFSCSVGCSLLVQRPVVPAAIQL